MQGPLKIPKKVIDSSLSRALLIGVLSPYQVKYHVITVLLKYNFSRSNHTKHILLQKKSATLMLKMFNRENRIPTVDFFVSKCGEKKRAQILSKPMKLKTKEYISMITYNLSHLELMPNLDTCIKWRGALNLSKISLILFFFFFFFGWGGDKFAV